MENKKKIDFVNILVLSFAFYFLSVGFAFLASLFEPEGVIANFEYWQKGTPPSQDEYEKMETSRIYAGVGVLAAIVIGFIGSILANRKSNYHWANSLLAIGVLIGIGFALKKLNYNPQAMMLSVATLLKMSAIVVNAAAGVLFTGISAFIFITYQRRESSPSRIKKEALEFQFEKEDSSVETDAI